MTNKTDPKPAAPATGDNLMFGPPPLLKGEDAAAYAALADRMFAHVKPSDIMEEIWVREIVDAIWETFRWRRHLAGFHDSVFQKTVARILHSQPKNHSEATTNGTSFTAQLKAAKAAANASERNADEWAASDTTVIEDVEGKLVAAGITIDRVVAQTTASELDKIERFNRLIANTEGRCNSLLREIERHRAAGAQKWQRTVHPIENDVFETNDAKAIAAKPN